MQAANKVLIFVTYRLVLVLTIGVFTVLGWYSVLLARADVSFRQNNLAAVQKAVQLTPSNAAYHALLAEHMEEVGLNPDQELAVATSLSPRDSVFWIRRAFRAEVERKYDESERYLLHAEKVDNGFDPRWALMNLYFRQGKMLEFWPAARRALEMSYGNLDPLFRLCLGADDDPMVTHRILPPSRDIRLAFFTYLLREPYIARAAPVAGEMAAEARPEDVPALLEFCDRRIGADAGVLNVWNTLCRRHLTPFAELAPADGKIVTNGGFTAMPLQQGFDWKRTSLDSISINPMDEAQGISVDLSGKQPEIATVLSQVVPVVPGKTYTVSFEYRLVSSAPDPGLQWVVQSADSPVDSLDTTAESAVLSSRDWSTGRLQFTAKAADTVRLAFRYRRRPGTLPWKGTVQLRGVSSARVPLA